jgi:hypothetical protein
MLMCPADGRISDIGLGPQDKGNKAILRSLLQGEKKRQAFACLFFGKY